MENSETSTKLKDRIVMVPVSSLDFKKLNEFAEATMIQRNPEKAAQIREMRRKKLQEHNQEIINESKNK